MWGKSWKSVASSQFSVLSSQFSVHVKSFACYVGSPACEIFGARENHPDQLCWAIQVLVSCCYGLTRTEFRMHGMPEVGIALQKPLKKFGRLGKES